MLSVLLFFLFDFLLFFPPSHLIIYQVPGTRYLVPYFRPSIIALSCLPPIRSSDPGSNPSPLYTRTWYTVRSLHIYRAKGSALTYISSLLVHLHVIITVRSAYPRYNNIIIAALDSSIVSVYNYTYSPISIESICSIICCTIQKGKNM